MSEGEMKRGWFGAASAVMQVLHQNIAVRRQLSRKTKLSIYLPSQKEKVAPKNMFRGGGWAQL